MKRINVFDTIREWIGGIAFGVFLWSAHMTQREYLESVAKELSDDGCELEICPRCHCCSLVWIDCENCGGEGVTGHDCGEDCCCCADPEDNVTCDICRGRGGFDICGGHCDDKGKHK